MCQNEKKVVRTQNVITFKPRYKKCPDFARGAIPTPGHPHKQEIPWESLMRILHHQNRRYAYWSKIVPIHPTRATYPKIDLRCWSPKSASVIPIQVPFNRAS